MAGAGRMEHAVAEAEEQQGPGGGGSRLAAEVMQRLRQAAVEVLLLVPGPQDGILQKPDGLDLAILVAGLHQELPLVDGDGGGLLLRLRKTGGRQRQDAGGEGQEDGEQQAQEPH